MRVKPAHLSPVPLVQAGSPFGHLEATISHHGHGSSCHVRDIIKFPQMPYGPPIEFKHLVLVKLCQHWFQTFKTDKSVIDNFKLELNSCNACFPPPYQKKRNGHFETALCRIDLPTAGLWGARSDSRVIWVGGGFFRDWYRDRQKGPLGRSLHSCLNYPYNSFPWSSVS